jgi:ADP-ribose pyrophosphatase YjhB (NUDIX family)
MSGKHIEIIARGICIKKGRLLLCHTKGRRNTYLPGGHVEFKERADLSLKREILEEMGLKARTDRFLGAVEHTFKQKGKRHCEVNLVFECSIAGLSIQRGPQSREDYIEFLWAPLPQLRTYHLEPSILCDLIPLWIKDKKRTSPWASTYPKSPA